MDIQAIIDKVVSEAQNAPEIVQELMADPGAAIEKVTGHSLGETDIAAVAEGVLAQVQEKGGDIVDQLSGLLGNIFGGKRVTPFPVCTMGSVRGKRAGAPFFRAADEKAKPPFSSGSKIVSSHSPGS